jgi:outer membrane PBP1 activator LpoA protein
MAQGIHTPVVLKSQQATGDKTIEAFGVPISQQIEYGIVT